MARVKYYSASDLSSGYHFLNGVDLLEGYRDESITEVNDAIEYWNIRKFFENGARCPEHDDAKHETLDVISKRAVGKACSFLSQTLRDTGVRNLISEVDRKYRDDFWEMCCVTGSISEIADDDITFLFECGEIAPGQFMRNKNLSDHFSELICMIIKAHPETYAGLILRERCLRHDAARKPLFLPKDLDDHEIVKLIEAYISSDHPHLNDLKVVITADAKSGLSFPPAIKLAAKRKYQALWEEAKDRAVSLDYGVGIAFKEGQDDTVVLDNNGTHFHLSYRKDWVRENRDFPSLMNNFIYLFGYTDLHCRVSLLAKKSQMSILEDAFGVKTNASYVTGTSFQLGAMVALNQMISYQALLESFNIRIEEVIEWFFNEWVSECFGLPSFEMSLPSTGANDLEKCRAIAPELESALKRYGVYVREGDIDEDILPFVKVEKFRDVPSLIEKKYVYGKGQDFETASYLLCSDQCMLSYSDFLEKSADSFYDLIESEDVKDCHIAEYERGNYNWLVEKGFVVADKNSGTIRLTEKAHVIQDLYENEFLVLNKQSNAKANAIKVMNEDGLVRFGSTLFATPEADYFSFVMNNETFDNALALRNRYEHGDPIPDELHACNYAMFLIVLVLAAIKINDELACHFEIDGIPDFV